MVALILNFLGFLGLMSYHFRQMQKSFCILLGEELIPKFLKITLEIFSHQR